MLRFIFFIALSFTFIIVSAQQPMVGYTAKQIKQTNQTEFGTRPADWNWTKNNKFQYMEYYDKVLQANFVYYFQSKHATNYRYIMFTYNKELYVELKTETLKDLSHVKNGWYIDSNNMYVKFIVETDSNGKKLYLMIYSMNIYEINTK